MENPSDTMESSSPLEETPPSSLGSEPGLNAPSTKVREWSQFELGTVCALICKHEHRQTSRRRFRRGDMDGKDSDDDWALRFATKLNEALHGTDEYQHDIPVADVREMMDFIETKNRNFMAYISRQSTPFRITRSKKYAFQRVCSDFNDSFCKWTVMRRERRRNANTRVDEEIPRFDSFDRYLSNPSQDSHLLGASRIQKILGAELDPATERGWVSDSVRTQRNHEGPAPNSNLNLSILPEESRRRAYRHPNQRGVIPHPPLPPSLPQHTRYEQMSVQQPNSYELTSYEGTGAYVHSHPTSPAYYSHLDPSFSASPYPPTSPAYFGRPELRQSIHPMGPRPDTSMCMASPAYQYHSDRQQDVYPTEQQLDAPGSFISPVHDSVSDPTLMGYQYPDPAQDNANSNYGRILETPASPSSPMYFPDAAPVEVMGTQTEEQGAISYSSELFEQPNFDIAHLDYGEYSPNYWPSGAH